MQRIPQIFRKAARPHLKKEVDPINKWRIVRGDTVEVLSGKEKGKQGVVQAVIRKKNQVIVEGLNMHTRRTRKTMERSGKMWTAPGPIHYSNVNLVDPPSGKPTRIAMRFLEDGTKIRVSKKSGTIIPYPEVLKERRTPRATEDGPLDTPANVATMRTVEDREVTLN